MICRDKIIFSCLIACGLGAAGGYIFSSKFCKVTIVNRVGKEIVLNQSLRKIFAEHAFWIHNSIQAAFCNNPAAKQIYLEKLQASGSQLTQILHSYYGTLATGLISQLKENDSLLVQLISMAEQKQPFSQITDQLRANFNAIATSFNDLNTSSSTKISMADIPFFITQEVIASQNNNISDALNFFGQYLHAFEKVADQINQAIVEQFGHKF